MLFEVATVVVVLLVAAFSYSKYKHSYWSSKGIRSPPSPYPFFGHLPILLRKEAWLYSNELYEKYGPDKVLGSYDLMSPRLTVLDAELVKTVLVKDFDHFVDRRSMKLPPGRDEIMNEILTITKGDHWKGVRSVLTPSFTSGRLKNMFPLVEAKADELVAYIKRRLQTEPYVELKTTFGAYTLEVISSCAFGVETNTLTKGDSVFSQKVQAMMKPSRWRMFKFVIFLSVPWLFRILRIPLSAPEVDFFVEVVEETIRRRENGEKRGDFMDIMLEAREDQKTPNSKTPKYKLETKTIVSNAFLFILAGFDTTGTTLSFIAFTLARYRNYQEGVRQELRDIIKQEGTLTYQGVMEAKLFDAVVNETLRLYPPAHVTERQCTKDYSFPDPEFRLKAGIPVSVPIWSLHHDARYWEAPGSFIPERFFPENRDKIVGGTYLPFGLGPRNCIECWPTDLTVNSKATMYTEDINGVTEYQVTPGSEVEVICSSHMVDPKGRRKFKGYNLTLMRRETNGKQEQEVVTSLRKLDVSFTSKASMTSYLYTCDVNWPGETKVLSSNTVIVRPIDISKKPSLHLRAAFHSNLTCNSSYFNSPSLLSTYGFWAHPKSEFTWVNPEGSSKSGSCCELSMARSLCHQKILTLGFRTFTAHDIGNYTLFLVTPGYDNISLNAPFFPSCPPHNTTIDIPGNVAKYVHANGSFIAKCMTWAYPAPNLSLDACSKNKCTELTRTTLKTTLPALNEKEWEVTLASPGPVINLTCTASANGMQDSIMDSFLLSDAASLLEHQIWNTTEVIEGDNVVLPCHLSVAMLPSHSSTTPLIWTKTDDKYASLSVENRELTYLHTALLSFPSVELSDDGQYICKQKKRNHFERVRIVILNVRVMESPSWVSSNETVNSTVTLHLQETKTLSCIADGAPKPTYTWTKDGKTLSLEKEEGGGDAGREGMVMDADGGGSLTILKGKESDAGLYTCEAQNRAGALKVWYKVEFSHTTTQGPKVVVIVAVTLVLMMMILYCAYRKWRYYKESLRSAAAWKEGNLSSLNASLSLHDQAHLLPFKPKYEISRQHITFDKLLGCGAFGRVYRASINTVEGESDLTVAVKMIRARSDKTQLLALQSELKIMMHIGKHVNIVNLVAACTKNLHKKDLMLVVEYCRFGNILDYMKRHRGTFVNQLTEDKVNFLSTMVRERSTTVGQTSAVESGGEVYITGDKVMFQRGDESQTTAMTTADSKSHLFPDPGGLGQGHSSAQLSATNTILGSDMTCHTLITDTCNLEAPSLAYELDTSRQLCSRDLLCWSFQVARGMDFLAYRKVLHGDLAARNVLLSDGNLVKISDFGLAKDIYKYDNYTKSKNSPLPVKWMSVEALRDGIFSTQSDVWAFGVVLWEIFSLGQCPFAGVTVDENFIKSLEKGHRMDRPKYSTWQLYEVMHDCWSTEPQNRPSFSTIEGRLSKMLSACDTKYYEELQKEVEAKEAEDQEIPAEGEAESGYLNMVCNMDYTEIVKPQDAGTNGTQEEEEEGAQYVNLNQATSIEEEQKGRKDDGGHGGININDPTVGYVVNKGYVSLSNAQSLMVPASAAGGPVKNRGFEPKSIVE